MNTDASTVFVNKPDVKSVQWSGAKAGGGRPKGEQPGDSQPLPICFNCGKRHPVPGSKAYWSEPGANKLCCQMSRRMAVRRGELTCDEAGIDWREAA